MTDLDQNETRALAQTLAHQLGPHLEGDALNDAAGNLMRLAARMAGHVAADAVGSGMAYGPDEDEAYARFLAVKEGMETLAGQAHDTGELMAEVVSPPRECDMCSEVGGHDEDCLTLVPIIRSTRLVYPPGLPCVECGRYGEHRMDCGTGRRSR